MQARKGLEGREEEGKREGRFLVLFFVGFLSIFCRFVTVFLSFFLPFLLALRRHHCHPRHLTQTSSLRNF